MAHNFLVIGENTLPLMNEIFDNEDAFLIENLTSEMNKIWRISRRQWKLSNHIDSDHSIDEIEERLLIESNGTISLDLFSVILAINETSPLDYINLKDERILN